jgi:uncharacterized membrane protein YccF (DUF307 family)
MNIALNLLWFLLNGIVLGPLWFIIGIIMAISLVGLPWAKTCFMLGNFACFPFGRDVISRKALTLQDDIGTSGFGTLGNIVWLLLFGWWLALAHIVWGVVCAITIIGIPFALQHFKLAGAALLPIGKTVQPKDLIALAKGRNAEQRLEALRGAQ